MGSKQEAIAEMTKAINILKQFELPQSSSGITFKQYETVVAQWQGESSPSQIRSNETDQLPSIIALYQKNGLSAVMGK